MQPRFIPLDAQLQPLSAFGEHVAVQDTTTGLIWAVEFGTDLDHAAAEAYCKALTLGSQSDWRLPTRVELFGITDDTRCRPAIDAEAFPTTPSDWFWTSTAFAAGSAYAWVVYFGFGLVNFDHRGYGCHARAVRGPVSVPGQ